MRVNTVLLPVKEMRFNPLTQREELVPTGYLQEYSAGKAIGRPIREPSMAPVPQDRAIPSSAQRGQEGHHSVTLHSLYARPLAAHYARPGETVGDAATRLGDAAARFEVVPGSNRAEARVDAGYVPFLRGNH